MRRGFPRLVFGAILVLTFFLASGSGMTAANFSVVGNQGVRRMIFLIWGALVGNYFFLYTDELMEEADCRDLVIRIFLWAALLLFMTAVGLPYLPERVPEISRLHVCFAFLAPAALGAAQVRFLMVLKRKGGFRLGSLWRILGALALGAVFLLVRIGIVSSLLEIFVTLGTCFYLFLLRREIVFHLRQ